MEHHSPFEEFEEPEYNVDPNKLWLSIWYRPKPTFEYILAKEPTKYVNLLFIINGGILGIDQISAWMLGDRYSLFMLFLIAIPLGALVGLVFNYLNAWVVSATGKWLGGTADAEQCRAVMAWSIIPTVATLFFLLPKIILLGDGLFTSNDWKNPEYGDTIWYTFNTLETLLGIWGFVLLLIGIKAAQKFGWGMTILNWFLSAIIIAIPIMIIVFMITISMTPSFDL